MKSAFLFLLSVWLWPSFAVAEKYIGDESLLEEPAGGFKEGKDLRIRSGTGTHHIYVPRDIVARKDCGELRELLGDISIIPGFMNASNFPCPWEPAPDEVANFVINGIAFRLPRDYLWHNRNDPDGNKESVYLMFLREDMSPASGTSLPAATVTAEITKGGLGHYPLKDGSRYPSHLVNYWVRASMSTLHNQGTPQGYIELSAEPIYLNHAFGLDYYKLPRKDAHGLDRYDFFVKGDVFKPDYWLACQGRWCTSVYALNDDINVTYGFDRSSLLGQKHFDLREELTEKLNSFIATKP